MGSVFPNFSFAQLCYAYVGDDAAPVMVMHIRAWVPISATETEIYKWVFVPKNASVEWKRLSQRAFVRALGVGGCSGSMTCGTGRV
ncbi:hypothetical protein ACIA5H_36210 [Nocardia sp. NPDC051900]|uniref:hypothetical protein n=1 Tax=Nocardia sp. NPDC051900 TaxID=3364326 RepID=UPI00379411B2